jgi:adenylate cyclase
VELSNARDLPVPAGGAPTSWGWAARHGLFLVAVAPLGAQLIGSGFNIWYNRVQIRPLLTEGQYHTFVTAIAIYNLAVYPLAVGLWTRAVF